MKKALVLEGGSLRSMFSAGVLDVFLEQGIDFNGAFGTSAGSLTLISFIAGQAGRTKRVNLNFAQEKDYVGYYTFLKNHSVFNFNYMFKEISDILIPLDREKFENSPCDFTATTTSCQTGKTVYHNKHTSSNIYKAIEAGSSMPILSPIINIDGEPYLDGGITDAAPYQKALDEGYDKIVLVLTREHGFLKSMPSPMLARLYAKHYSQYPQFFHALMNTSRMYERQMREIDRLEYEKRIFVIRPEKPVNVSRMERDTTKLLHLYEEGRQNAEKNLENLAQYFANK
ncbi:patatin-like phospholipase family protein [Scatolibacter rhodanostii]|uniref:patatin-like phospholipase family protein n=1 Tax=Scatolibacter rhodanostii TaxID=2014781 RepID=UPI0013565E13|nr:patatin family protein [Scatolibacter rhodanostii]